MNQVLEYCRILAEVVVVLAVFALLHGLVFGL